MIRQKNAIRDKSKPLSFQKMRPKDGQPKVTWLKHPVMPSRMGKCQSQLVLWHLKK
jgi:hypothetical protein